MHVYYIYVCVCLYTCEDDDRGCRKEGREKRDARDADFRFLFSFCFMFYVFFWGEAER